MDSLQLATGTTPIFSGRGAKINLHTTPKLTVAMPISCLPPCADPGIFVRGGGGGFYGNLAILSPQLILQKSNG